MTTFTALVVTLAAAIAFYIGLPLVGAFRARAAWRSFRTRLVQSLPFPSLADDHDRSRDGYHGDFRFFGGIEAIQEDGHVWLSDGVVSVAVEVRRAPIYVLSTFVPDQEPQVVPWERMHTLPAGTGMFVAGALHGVRGRRFFRASAEGAPLIVVYDSDPREMLRQAIRAARGRNEYWNTLTPVALVGGGLALAFLSLLLFSDPWTAVPARLALTLATAPAAAIAPPGIGLYMLYRMWWRRARALRAERDVFRLPLLPLGEEGMGPLDPPVECALPNGERYVGKRFDTMEADLSLEPAPVRLTSADARESDNLGEYYVFGAAGSGEDCFRLRSPSDPMVGFYLLRGHPADRAAACGRLAARYTMLAASAVIGSVFLNLAIVFLVITTVVR